MSREPVSKKEVAKPHTPSEQSSAIQTIPGLEQLDLNELSTNFVRQTCSDSVRLAEHLEQQISARLSRLTELAATPNCPVALDCPELRPLLGLSNLTRKTNGEVLLARARFEKAGELAQTNLLPILDTYLAQAESLNKQRRTAKDTITQLTQKCSELEHIVKEAAAETTKSEQELRLTPKELVIEHHKASSKAQSASRKLTERTGKLSEKQEQLSKATRTWNELAPRLERDFTQLMEAACVALTNFIDQVNKNSAAGLVVPDSIKEFLSRSICEQEEAKAKAAEEESRRDFYRSLVKNPPLKTGCAYVFTVIEADRDSTLIRLLNRVFSKVDKHGWGRIFGESPEFRVLIPQFLNYLTSRRGATEITSFLRQLEEQGLVKLSKEAGTDCAREFKMAARALYNYAKHDSRNTPILNQEESLNILKTCLLMHALGDAMPSFLTTTAGHKIGILTSLRLKIKYLSLLKEKMDRLKNKPSFLESDTSTPDKHPERDAVQRPYPPLKRRLS